MRQGSDGPAPRKGGGGRIVTSFKDVRMRGFQDRAEVDAVVALIDGRVRPLPPEDVSLRAAAGRVLAADVTAAVAVPGFDRAAMDGYALRGGETFGAGPYNPLEFEVVGESLPGRPFAGRVGPGQAVRIMTGAPLPDGADAVLPAENAEEAGGRVRVSEPSRRGDTSAGAARTSKRARWSCGPAACCGPRTWRCWRRSAPRRCPWSGRPRVAILVTGR